MNIVSFPTENYYNCLYVGTTLVICYTPSTQTNTSCLGHTSFN